MSVTLSRPFDIDDIFDSIVEGKSIVVLGPNFYADSKAGTHQDQMLGFFNDNKVAYKHYYEEDGFFLFNEDFERTLACQKIKRFYKNVQPSEQLRKIAKIPFHIYLTVTPDKLLCKTFEQLDYSIPQTAHYKKNTEPQVIKTPTSDNPLIYNAFGVLDDEESIILTHDDLYDYFKSIFSLKSMPEKVKKALKRVQNIIFLGVPFQKWYMHLLLREFGAHENKKIIRFAADQSVSDEVRTFCYNQFKIHFIDHNITQFVNTLHDKFEEEGELRSSQTQKENGSIKQMKDLIRKGKLDEAIQLLEDYTEDPELKGEVLKLSGRYHKHERGKRNGELTHEQQTTEEAKFNSTALALINKAENL